jgi:hypothetical protein
MSSKSLVIFKKASLKSLNLREPPLLFKKASIPLKMHLKNHAIVEKPSHSN